MPMSVKEVRKMIKWLRARTIDFDRIVIRENLKTGECNAYYEKEGKRVSKAFRAPPWAVTNYYLLFS